MWKLRAMLATALFAVTALAQSTGSGGIIYTKNHAFMVSAPDGWVLDTNSSQNNGLPAVFYPVGSSWAESDVVMYANTAQKIEGQQTVPELIAYDTQQFRAKGPKLSVVELPSVETADGKAVVRKFSGDQYNNYEAVAYIDGPKAIAMLVLTSRDEHGFSGAYPSFEKLVRSYRFLTADVRFDSSKSPQ